MYEDYNQYPMVQPQTDFLHSPLVNNLVYGNRTPDVPLVWDPVDRRNTIAELFIAIVILLLIWYVMRKV
jgi:hypothetical protein